MKNILTITGITISMFISIGCFNVARAYSVESSSSIQMNDLTRGINNLFGNVLKGFGGKATLNMTQAYDSTAQKPASNSYFNFSNFSKNDIISVIKAVATLSFNLFVEVIQIVIQILQALLGALSPYLK